MCPHSHWMATGIRGLYSTIYFSWRDRLWGRKRKNIELLLEASLPLLNWVPTHLLVSLTSQMTREVEIPDEYLYGEVLDRKFPYDSENPGIKLLLTPDCSKCFLFVQSASFNQNATSEKSPVYDTNLSSSCCSSHAYSAQSLKTLWSSGIAFLRGAAAAGREKHKDVCIALDSSQYTQVFQRREREVENHWDHGKGYSEDYGIRI